MQNTLNWWRCEGFPFRGGEVCQAAYVAVACPTRELGFKCPNTSKKGLLGLLGLLALIPLFLLLCCSLLICCIRRKKTEGDVHFATFDPHAAPMGGSIAPATACYAPSVGAPIF